MERDDFIDMLARAVTEGWISEEQATELLAAFTRGTIDPAMLPLPLLQAMQVVEDPKLVYWWPNDVERLTDEFYHRVGVIAGIASSNVTVWHRRMQALLVSYLGHVSVPVIEIVTQLAYLSRFADNIAILSMTNTPLSAKRLAHRARLYAGKGREYWYRVQEQVLMGKDGEGWVVDYISHDDKDTCSPCIVADNGSPYLPGRGIFPGDVCLGACRCIRLARYAPSEYRKLIGGAA